MLRRFALNGWFSLDELEAFRSVSLEIGMSEGPTLDENEY